MTPRANIVLGHPPGQLEHLRVDERNRVEHVDHVLQFTRIETLRRRRVNAYTITDGQSIASTQWHTEPLSRTDGLAWSCRSPIGEHLIDRPVDHHADERRSDGMVQVGSEPERGVLGFVGTGFLGLAITIDHG